MDILTTEGFIQHIYQVCRLKPGTAFLAAPVRSSPLRPFPRVLLCPLSIPKVTIVYGVGCSLNLNISYYCSSVSWEYPQNLPLSGHPLLQKARTFGLGPPRPPLNKHNKFQHTVPSHIKSCTAHWGWEGGPRQKARLFVTEGI